MYASSEDEVDVLLHGTPDQKRKLIRECLTGESESSSEDEFEKEMEAELNSTMKTMEDKLSSMGTGKLWALFPQISCKGVCSFVSLCVGAQESLCVCVHIHVYVCV